MYGRLLACTPTILKLEMWANCLNSWQDRYLHFVTFTHKWWIQVFPGGIVNLLFDQKLHNNDGGGGAHQNFTM